MQTGSGSNGSIRSSKSQVNSRASMRDSSTSATSVVIADRRVKKRKGVSFAPRAVLTMEHHPCYYILQETGAKIQDGNRNDNDDVGLLAGAASTGFEYVTDGFDKAAAEDDEAGRFKAWRGSAGMLYKPHMHLQLERHSRWVQPAVVVVAAAHGLGTVRHTDEVKRQLEREKLSCKINNSEGATLTQTVSLQRSRSAANSQCPASPTKIPICGKSLFLGSTVTSTRDLIAHFDARSN